MRETRYAQACCCCGSQYATSPRVLCVHRSPAIGVPRLCVVYWSCSVAPQEGNTALMWACRYSLIQIVRYLIAAKAKVNRRNKCGQTALMLAAESKDDKAVHAVLVVAMRKVLHMQDKVRSSAVNRSSHAQAWGRNLLLVDTLPCPHGLGVAGRHVGATLRVPARSYGRVPQAHS